MFSCRIDEDAELRIWEQRHAETVFALVDRNREHLREWLPWVDSTKEVEDSRKFIEGALQQFAANDGFHAGIWCGGKLAGGIGCHKIDWANMRVEIGYWLSAEFQGRGLVTKACRAVIDHAFNDLGLNRVEIHCAAGNKKSRAVAKRLGFCEEGTLREAHLLNGRFVDMVIYGMLKHEWNQNQEWKQNGEP